jgi:MFS family permease
MKSEGCAAAWGSVLILLLGYGSAFIDRQVLSLLVGSIRSDLNISDTQFSLLHGFAFALFYALLGIPVGRWVDKGHRPLIFAAGMVTWSAFTALCGVSRNFSQLFLFRMGVGVGEATVVPVAYSLIADYFPPQRRGLALGIFGAGVYLGVGGAMLVGGALVEVFDTLGPVNLPFLGHLQPWQMVLLSVGAPGVALALLSLLLHEPRRGTETRSTMVGRVRAPFRPLEASARHHYRVAGSAILLHHLCVAFMATALYAVLAWTPEHFRRSFGILPSESAGSIGVVIVLTGTLGVILGGAVSDHLLKQTVASARLLTLAGSAVLAVPFALVLAFSVNNVSALIGLGGFILWVSTLTSVGAAGLQELMPSHLRGIGSAIYQLVVNLIGLSAGPTLIALVTDYVFADEQKLSTALGITLPPILLVSAACAVGGLKRYSHVSKLAGMGYTELHASSTCQDLVR